MRPRIPKALATRTFNRHDNPHGVGHCWHCGVRLDPNKRSSWHVDHHPIPYRDIEDQVCCGVRDPLDPSNLVPSCPGCNMRHEHEGHQCRCRGAWFRQARQVLFCMALFGSGLLIGWAAREC